MADRDKRISVDFSTHYQSLCSIQSTYPLVDIIKSTREGILNCLTYKLKRFDWTPLLTALRANRTLHTVIFRDKWEERAQYCLNDDTVRARIPHRLVTKATDSQTVHEITRSLKPFLSQCHEVSCLLLEGLNIDLKDIKLLAKGLERNQSLKLLSLKGSGAGDKGVQVLCQVLKYCHTIEWIDLTWCHLTSDSTIYLSELIRYQCLHRQSSVWKNSLRGGQCPSQYITTGLKRLTLNINPNIRDNGAITLAAVLEDDIWIKENFTVPNFFSRSLGQPNINPSKQNQLYALDMQTCGLTTESAHIFQRLLSTSNSGLMVLDMRENRLMDDEEVDVIIDILGNKKDTTSGGNQVTNWLEVEIIKIQSELRSNGVPMHHMKQSGPVKMNKSSWVKRKGLPWRTAVRSSQRWRNSLPKSISTSHHSQVTNRISSSVDSSHSQHSDHLQHNIPYSTSTSLTSEGYPVQVTLTLEQFKQLQTEIKLCHLKLKEDEQIKLQMKSKIKQLEDENKLLTETINEKEHFKTNESTINNIESTFKQFHDFLDLLSKKGYGHLTQLMETKLTN